MAYLGTPIDTTNQFQSLQGKRFSGDASTTAFTLDIAPSSVFDIEVFVENVRQDPNSAYGISGTTLTFTGAPPSGTNNIYVVHQAKAVGTIDVPASSVVPASLASNIISGHTALTTPPATTDEFLISDAGTIKRIDYSVLGNTPAFMVVTGTDLTISTGTWTKATNWATPIYDTDSAFSSSKFTVPTGKGGKYIFHAHVYFTSTDDGKKVEARLYKNGSNAGSTSTGSATVRKYTNGSNRDVDIGWTWVADLSAGDYIEYYVNQNNGDNQTLYRESWLSGQRLIGV